MKSGIYKFLSWIDGKVYIGCATNLRKRKDDHKYLLRRGKHSNKHLQSAWLKYGENNFTYSIIEHCEKENLVEREQFWIDSTNCTNDKFGYNICKIANSQIGMKHTEETKRRISEAKKGFKHSLEEIERIRLRMTGFKHSPESKIKMSEIQKAIAKFKPDKWPHGWRCKCDECKAKKSEYGKNWYKQKKLAA